MVKQALTMKELRTRSGLRAEDIASELGVSINTVKNWDRNATAPRMTPQGLQRLMTVYKCTFLELVDAEDFVDSDKIK